MTVGPLHGPGRPAGPRLTGPLAEAAPLVVALPTAADTYAFGRRLGRVLRAGDLVLLDGPLGAGKTALTQGIGAGMGVTGAIASPTFVIARVHPAGDRGGATLVHVDAYRLGSLEELDDLDLDVDAQDSVTVVEWGTGVAERLAEAHLTVRLARAAASDERTATLVPQGGDWADRIGDLGPAETAPAAATDPAGDGTG